jgi:cyclopropane fatty-acyl-phospholipid synthase-like methyltransferase
MRLQQTITSQFERPRGLLGQMTGWIMAHRRSNRDRNRWTVDLLDIQHNDHVLELGCGPGLALQGCLARATDGLVIGLDHSETMLQQAAARNRAALLAGRLQLRLGRAETLVRSSECFDKIFSVNVVQFLDDRPSLFSTFYDHLKQNGLVATTYMPRGENPSRAKAWQLAETVRHSMETVGFTQIRIEELPLQPVPAVCVIGSRQ